MGRLNAAVSASIAVIVGAVTIGDWIYVAGGGAVLGGSVQSAVHEAFTLA
jgi:hypothetical protein